MNKYAVMYKKERVILLATDRWTAKKQAGSLLGLTKSQEAHLGVEELPTPEKYAENTGER